MRFDQTVILDSALIETIGPSASTTILSGAQIADLTGHTLAPGIVGLHEHTDFGGAAWAVQMNDSGPLLYLACGVTTAMTAGSMLPYHELSLRRATDRARIPGPRLLITRPYLHGDAGPNAFSLKVATPEAARRAVAYWAAEGATWFKFQGTVSRAVLAAAIEEAHKRGLRVTGHLCSVTFTEAAVLGIDLLQHGFITNPEYLTGKKPDVCPPGNQQRQADVASPEVQESIRTIVSRGAAIASMLAAYETFIPEHPIEARGLEFFAPPQTGGRADPCGPAGPRSTWPSRLLQKMMAWERAFVAAGGLLGACVDRWETGMLSGLGNLRNYELLAQAGFTPKQAFQIMTLNSARILGEDEHIGSIATGKRADLMIVRGDPVRTPSAIYDVVMVFRDGIGFDSATLREAARGRVGAN